MSGNTAASSSYSSLEGVEGAVKAQKKYFAAGSYQAADYTQEGPNKSNTALSACDIMNLCSNEVILLVLLHMLSTCHASMLSR